MQDIPLFVVQMITLDPPWVDLVAEVSQQTGLLHNDALIVVAMRLHGLANLASADADFDRVPGITRYGPV
ncbi:MAG: type II toxin-antitoxin system VapC family toxin [Isosphaeraceae bacterium]